MIYKTHRQWSNWLWNSILTKPTVILSGITANTFCNYIPKKFIIWMIQIMNTYYVQSSFVMTQSSMRYFNSSLPPGQNGCCFADNIFKCIFLNENEKIQIQISLKLVSRIPIDNKGALAQVMAWCRTGDKPLPDPMMTHFTDAYMRH